MSKHERRQQGVERGDVTRMTRRLFASGGANLPAATILGIVLLGTLSGCAKPPVPEPTLPRDESAASESPPPPGMAIPPSMLERAAAGQPVSDPNDPALSPAEPAPSPAEPAAPEAPKESSTVPKPEAPAAEAPAADEPKGAEEAGS